MAHSFIVLWVPAYLRTTGTSAGTHGYHLLPRLSYGLEQSQGCFLLTLDSGQDYKDAVISLSTAGSLSLLSPKPLEITFDCGFGTEFNTLRNVPGSLEVLIRPRGGNAEALGKDTWRISPFWGATEKLNTRRWVDGHGASSSSMKMSQTFLRAFLRICSISTRMIASRLC